jgi:hypothetical protein
MKLASAGPETGGDIIPESGSGFVGTSNMAVVTITSLDRRLRPDFRDTAFL